MNTSSAGIWVKASERLPSKPGDYHTKVNHSTHIENSCTDFNGQEFDDCNVIEWLDESAANNGMVGEKSKEGEEGLTMIMKIAKAADEYARVSPYYTTATVDKIIAFKAGASFVMGEVNVR